MSTLDTQNAKQIRDPMRVRGELSGVKKTEFSVSVTGAKIFDTDVAGASYLAWDMITLADFAGGIPLNGKAQFYGNIEHSESAGKFGIRSMAGAGFKMTVTAAVELGALTIQLANDSASGTVKADGITYEFDGGDVIMVPCEKKLTLTFAVASGVSDRIRVQSVCAGVQMTLTEDNITDCTVALRSDLSLDNPNWQVSEIEYKVYWPYDITEVLSTVSDDTKLTYSAGYKGDMSPKRKFYLADKISQDGNLVTIKGVDASDRLDKDMPAELRYFYSTTAAAHIYKLLCDMVEDAKIKATVADAPTKATKKGTATMVLMESQSRRDVVAYIINLMRGSAKTSWGASAGAGFYPEFVDAGRPLIRWEREPVRWTIRETDCGDVVDEYERDCNKFTITTPNTTIESAEKQKYKAPKKGTKNYKKKLAEYKYKVKWNGYFKIQEKKVKKGKEYKIKYTTPYVEVAVDNGNAKIVKRDIMWCKIKGLRDGKVTLYGHRLTTDEDPKETVMTAERPGTAVEISYEFNGAGFVDAKAFKETAFHRNKHTGSFRWKGDPRMQPRDRFTFVRKNGKKQTCTIESITLVHSGGGTYADIAYREDDD